MLTDEDLNTVYEQELNGASKDGAYLGMSHSAALTTVLCRPIQTIYLKYASHAVRNDYHRLLVPCTEVCTVPPAFIMWINTVGKREPQERWTLNHFVPLLRISPNQLVEVEDTMFEEDGMDEMR